jgi:hypothetical protein
MNLPVIPRRNITKKTMSTVEQEILCRLARPIKTAKAAQSL